MTNLKSRLTYANVMATIAVFLALGGVATAITIPKKSVGAKQLKKDAVTNPKVADAAIGNAELGANAVNGAKVQDRSIGLSKTAILDTTVTQNFGNVAANSCQSIAKDVPAQVQNTDLVAVVPDASVTPDAGDGDWYGGALTAEAGPTGLNNSQIRLHVCNPTAAASADPGNTTFRILVFR